jgi:hypothetical protein
MLVAGSKMSHFIGATSDNLETVAMEVEGVFSCVVVVQDNINNLTLCQYRGIGVSALDSWISGSWAG